MSREKILRITYWATTVLFSVFLTWSAIQYLNEAPRMQATMIDHLGYPEYFPKILAAFKLAGVCALLVPEAFGPNLKEWAYAGFTFDLLGAFASHLSVGDSFAIAGVPLAFLVLLGVSYWTWKRTPTSTVMRQEAPRDGTRSRPVTAH